MSKKNGKAASAGADASGRGKKIERDPGWEARMAPIEDRTEKSARAFIAAVARIAMQAAKKYPTQEEADAAMPPVLDAALESFGKAFKESLLCCIANMIEDRVLSMSIFDERVFEKAASAGADASGREVAE